ncbi:diglucosylglycerate octanoyltransferase [Tsukamurella sp. 1534]|uniref:diglucosylglycerate octanoyltransferase n=1 Tax=Tsukamurella sp. 1534 TaxID=1151061 RepID=UPI0002E903D1|nr:diglucosylglycerate octanoyltransferase [Tsukamurella sp. 1534]
MTGTLLVLSDSLGFYGPEGALPATDPRIWPNLVAEELGLRCELFARVGWTTRDGWWCVSQDPRVWAAVPDVRAAVLALGGMDSLPSPVPTALREQIRYLRPAALRARARDGYAVIQRVFSPVGWPMALPPKVTAEYLGKTYDAIAALRPEAPVAVMGPAVHRTRAYAYAQPGWAATDAAMREWADGAGVPFVPVRDLCEWSFDLGINNIDGIHWSFEMHEQVARRVLRGLHAAEGSTS